MSERRCDCYRFVNQVCDICQGTGGKDAPPPPRVPWDLTDDDREFLRRNRISPA